MTVEDGYCLVALGKGAPRVGSIRGPLGGGLTIRSPKVGIGKFSATLAISLRLSNINKRAQRALECSPESEDF